MGSRRKKDKGLLLKPTTPIVSSRKTTALLQDVKGLISQARQVTASAVNSALVLLY